MEKQLFDDAIGEVPPSTVDVEAAITRGRRADRVRRVANPAVAAGVAVVLLTGAVAYTMTKGDGGVGVVGDQPTTTVSQTPPPTTERKPNPVVEAACARPDLESPAEVVARLSPVVKTAVQAQRSDLELVGNSITGYRDGVVNGPLDFYQDTGQESGENVSICDESSAFVAMATTKGPEGDGNIQIIVSPDFLATPGTSDCAQAALDADSCTEATGPNGEPIAKATFTNEDGAHETRIDIERPDGTEVMITVEDIATTSQGGGAPTATALPLTFDQLVAIGTDPALTLFP
jgi:hypothetical protein